MVKTVIWSRLALSHNEIIRKRILKDTKSKEIANKVINAIFDSSDILETHPELYKLDRFKTNNNGTYRAYEVYSYRISYRVLKTKIRILRVRHTSREPLEY